MKKMIFLIFIVLTIYNCKDDTICEIISENTSTNIVWEQVPYKTDLWDSKGMLPPIP